MEENKSGCFLNDRHVEIFLLVFTLTTSP